MKQQHVAPRLVARALAVAAFALGAQFALAADVKVALSGDQEVPPVKTEAKGTGTIMVNDDKSVSGSITVSGLTPTAAHIHEAAAGKNGGVIIPLTKSGDGFAVPRAPSSRTRSTRRSRRATCTSTCTRRPIRGARSGPS